MRVLRTPEQRQGTEDMDEALNAEPQISELEREEQQVREQELYKLEILEQERKDREEKEQKRLEEEEAADDRLRARKWAIPFERGRLQCLTLCADMHTALPRELRDLIYAHLFAPVMDHHVIEARDYKGQVRTSNNPLVSTSFFDPRARMPEEVGRRRDVWKYAEYTGPIVAKEIAEHWYRCNTFSIYAEDDLFQRFLTTDVWERGVVPADAVRHLRVVIPATLDHRNRLEVKHTMDALPGVTNTQAEIVVVNLESCNASNLWRLNDPFGSNGRTLKRLRALGYGKVRVRMMGAQ